MFKHTTLKVIKMNKKLVVAIAALLGSSAVMADNAAATYAGFTTFASQDVETVGNGGGANTSGGFFGASGWFGGIGGVDTSIQGGGGVDAQLNLDVQVTEVVANTIVQTETPVSGSAFAGMSMGALAQTSADDSNGTVEGSVSAFNSADLILSGNALGSSFGSGNLESIANVDTASGSPWLTTLQLHTDSDTNLCVNPIALNLGC